MPTKAELEDDLATAQLALVEALAGKSQAESEFAALTTEYNEVNEACKAAEASLQAALTVPASKSAPAALAPAASLTGIDGTEGLIIFADAFYFEQEWAGANVRSHYAVDFYGEHSEYLAHRQKRLPTEKLADGTWRIVTPDRTYARNTQHGAQEWLKQNDSEGHITVSPVKASALQALDATRELGAGIVASQGKPAFGAIKGRVAGVQVYKVAGKVVSVTLAIA